MASLEQATTIIKQLEDVVGKGAENENVDTTRREAIRLSKLLTASLEKPEDLAFEMGLLPSFALCCRIAVKLNIFSILTERPGSMNLSELVSKTNAEALLLALGLIQEVAKEEYKALPVTQVMAAPPMMAAQRHFWDQSVSSMAKFPEWLDKNGLKCPSDSRDGLLQYAFGTKMEAFEYWHSKPQILDNVNTLMEGVRSSRPAWVDWFPVQERILNDVKAESDAVVLVDVAGGRGHDLEAFRAHFPQGKGKLVLEDLPAVIDDVKSVNEGIVLQKHDFFQPQPVKGARAYYFSHIFHDWSDDPSIKILKQTATAMTKGYSKIFINDIIIPDTNCSLFQAGFDINMMAMHAGIERSRDQWTALLHKAGFEILRFWLPPGDGEGIVEAVLR